MASLESSGRIKLSYDPGAFHFVRLSCFHALACRPVLSVSRVGIVTAKNHETHHPSCDSVASQVRLIFLVSQLGAGLNTSIPIGR